MKWNLTLGLMGTSVNLTFLNSAPIYSLKRFELVGVAWTCIWEIKRASIMRRVMNSLANSIVTNKSRFVQRLLVKWILPDLLHANYILITASTMEIDDYVRTLRKINIYIFFCSFVFRSLFYLIIIETRQLVHRSN